MSLQVWLPLTRDINSQGLCNVPTTSINSASIATGGKLGNCLSLLSDGQAVSLNSYMDVCSTYTRYSMSAWIYMSSTATNHSSSILSSGDWNSGSGQLCFGLYSYSSDGYYKILVPNKSSWSNGISLSNPIKLNTWYNICIIYDGNSTRGYVNGEYVGSYVGGGITSSSNSRNLYVGSATYYNGFTLKGSMNDVRIYDHCLSAKEVNEISKGLCLHYNLAAPYIESTTNLYSGWSTNCYNGATNKYNYGTSTDVYYDNLDGIIRVRMGTNNLDAWPYVFFNNITPPSNGEYRTLSFDYYPTIKDGVNFYTYNTSGTITWIANGVKGTGGNIPVNTNSWNHISVTIKNTGSSDSGYGYMRIGLEKHTSNTSNYWLFKNIQVEDKDHSTPFVIGSRDESTVYDCSGLANNGTKIGGVTPSSNPLPIRYDKSYDFDGNTGSVQIPNLSTLVPSGEFTMNCWIYHDNTWSSEGYETIFGGPSGFELDAKQSTTNSPVLYACDWGKGKATYELNKWNMITMTRNASETKFYINGELKITGSAGSIPPGSYFVGAWKTSNEQNYKGKISDFRLYSTVLSVDDIKTLYNTSASVDKNGNMYAYEFKEE